MQNFKALHKATSRFLYYPGNVTMNDLTLLQEKLPEYELIFLLDHLVRKFKSTVLKKPLYALTLQEVYVYMEITGEKDVLKLWDQMQNQRADRLGGEEEGCMTVADVYLKTLQEHISLEKVLLELCPEKPEKKA